MSEKTTASADKKTEVKSENSAAPPQKSDSSQFFGSPVDRILFLQRTIGNQAVGKLISSGALQTKLRVNEPGDIYEKEADRVAEQVIQMPAPVQRKCPKCEEELRGQPEKKEEKPQAKEASGSTSEVASELESRINSLKGGGQPLQESTRAFFEPRFGRYFSQVRVHADEKAAESEQAQQNGRQSAGPEDFNAGKINDFEVGFTPSPLTVQRTCVEGSWVFEYDGCSLPWYVLPLIGTLDKDNPAGGTDTQFSNLATGPCDRHDECYQTCNPSSSARKACDRRMYDDMMNVCRMSAAPPEIKSRCFHFAGVYYMGLKAFGRGAFDERQTQVCYCQTPPSSTPGTFQAKLRIGQPGDVYEQEADRVAEKVMRMPESQIVSGNDIHIRRACQKCEENELKRQPTKEEEEEKLQRQPMPVMPEVVARRPGDADDLTGTVYDSFHPSLKAALTTKFPKGSHTRLADALNDLTNETVAILTRIGSRIGDYDPDVWTYIKAIPTSGWITDNWGAMFPVDTTGMIAHLTGSPKWCKDDPDSAKEWHGTENCWREPAGGMPGLHIPVRDNGTSDLHVDYHQPVEMGSGGNCRFWTTPGGLIGHAEDVLAGGGARLTGVAMYSQHRARLDTAAADGVDPGSIEDARKLLDSIANKVRQYASQGQLQGSEFAGDKAMAADEETMMVLKRVHILLYPHDLPVAGVP